jgi:hypothetical protein
MAGMRQWGALRATSCLGRDDGTKRKRGNSARQALRRIRLIWLKALGLIASYHNRVEVPT